MTLVVSEITKNGITMVGDSAITFKHNGSMSYRSGASKIHYNSKVNIGCALWGNAMVRGRQLDIWVDEFLNYFEKNHDIDDLAQRLSNSLKIELEQEGKPWDELAFGIHVAGYRNGLPRLWHIHCGHANEPPHEPRLYHDYPEDQGWRDEHYQMNLINPAFFCHLRNGYIPHYAKLFESIKAYSSSLKNMGINFPQNTLEGRIEFHKLLIEFVAGVLYASKENLGVNSELSSIGFSENGLLIDERIPMSDWFKNAENLEKPVMGVFF